MNHETTVVMPGSLCEIRFCVGIAGINQHMLDIGVEDFGQMPRHICYVDRDGNVVTQSGFSWAVEADDLVFEFGDDEFEQALVTLTTLELGMFDPLFLPERVLVRLRRMGWRV